MEVERWLDAVQELLSRDVTGLGDKENLQEELNQCKVRGQYNKMKTMDVLLLTDVGILIVNTMTLRLKSFFFYCC